MCSKLTYKYEFETDNIMTYVHFIDYQKSIDVAESLAQVGHANRRQWARSLINKMRTSEVQVMKLSFSPNMECPFERRLKDENWLNSAVALMICDTHHSLCIYRLYILYFLIILMNKLFSMRNCRHLQKL